MFKIVIMWYNVPTRRNFSHKRNSNDFQKVTGIKNVIKIINQLFRHGHLSSIINLKQMFTITH